MGAGMRWFLWAACLAGILGAGQAFAEIAPVASASRCTTPAESCAAPLAIFFSARGTDCTTSECDNNQFDDEAFHALSYKWDFGDPGSGTWAVSGQSKNLEYSPIAVHVFDTAGAYPISLEINSASESSSTTPFTIYVDDPDTVYADATRCISTNTNHDGCPSGAMRISNESDFDNAVENAIFAGYKRILFHAGQTFTLNDVASIGANGPGTIGSYGTANGGKAIIDGRGCLSCHVWNATGASVRSDWRLMDLEILQTRSENGGHSAIFLTDGGNVFENTLYYHLKRMNGNRAIGSMRSGAHMPRGAIGLFIVENEVAGAWNNLYVATQRGGVLGNLVGSRNEKSVAHTWRIGSPGAWEDMIVAHNETRCCAATDTTFRGESGVDSTEFMVIRANTFNDTRETSGDYPPVSIFPQNPGSNERLKNVIVENNRFSTFLAGLSVKTITVRNNFFLNGAYIEVSTNHACSIPDDWADDIMIYNNSVHGTAAGADFIRIGDVAGCAAKLSDTHVIRNNLLWNPNSNAEVYECGAFCGTVTASNNIDRDDMASTPFAADPPSIDDSADWHLTGPSSNAAIGAGYPMGSMVSRDFENGQRPGDDASWDIGAIESDASGSPPPPPARPAPPVLLDP